MSDLSLTVYTPASPLRHPGRMIGEMWRDLFSSRELAWRLFVRDTSAMYRQTFLGYIWAFVPPLMAALPFMLLNRSGILEVPGTGIPYPAYVMIGTLIWQVFVDALNSPLKSVNAAKSMLARINFPREAILLAGLYQVGLNFLFRLVLLVGVLAWFRVSLPATALLLPVGVFALVGLGFMIGLILTPLGMLYGDVSQALPFATSFLMFFTPVLYPVPAEGLLAKLMHWNPVTPLIVATREWLTVGPTLWLGAFVAVTAVTMLLLFCGWVLYRLAMPHLVARLGG